MHVDLTADEAAMLKALLTDCITDLRREVARTDNHRFRHQLVQREEFCEQLIVRLDSGASRVPAAPAL
jgi:hypothetical protein